MFMDTLEIVAVYLIWRHNEALARLALVSLIDPYGSKRGLKELNERQNAWRENEWRVGKEKTTGPPAAC